MALLTLAFLGGILAIISPCILPVLPFVFSKVQFLDPCVQVFSFTFG